ncbi:DUF2179 domain-containing protein [Tuberibacillus calidus]|jgi:uncharacterized protein YebE (UPF0316 family)|uniref:DUF2179 domain-containing protein n=1 Tax=Tuberibacillus calidus TaxID=340097 RepID=UPI000422BEAE|nr:DUF2179 domain-containing protein [Tuberibacillus calidus]
MLQNGLIMVAIIFVINIVYVSFFTIRMILTLKGYRYLAAFVSVFEVLIYVLGLGLVINHLNQVQNLMAYALGYGFGVICGMKIEEKLALGYITVNVITSRIKENFTESIREKGYGVTEWVAHGRSGERLMMEILTPRRNERNLMDTIKQLDPNAFIISHEPRNFHGGFWVKTIGKRLAP